ncbi:heparinase II/III family protein [Streptomyces sp. ISL-12]|uniref:heparinase II/III domain-containing protein n=1 Tax=Streptomyces sp. ISL-12 TaxID=2819177 RepID=UPI001BE9E5FF|nr:heparinase II/III family protein [Streptomyces sp. ISL-12]MBT2411523.1 heparinase II/III family protein [Streptomyces sp. ISL-12]
MNEHHATDRAEAGRLSRLLTPEVLTHALDSGAGRDFSPYPPATDRARWSRLRPASVRAVLDAAGPAVTDPWPVLLASQWRTFRRTGDRTAYERGHFERRRRVVALALALAVTGEERYGDALVDGVWLLCEESSWCVPAHDTSATEPGRSLPRGDVPVLDLFAAETAALLAWTAHLHGAYLADRTPELAARLRELVTERLTDPYLERATRSHWYALPSNWNPWITSNVIAAVLLTDDTTERRVRALRLAVRSLDAYFDGVPRDGGCDEGIMYWWQSAARAFEALDLLALLVPRCEDAVFGDPLLGRMARYPLAVNLDAEWSANFGDGGARLPPRGAEVVKERNPASLLYRFGLRVGDEEVRRHARALRGSAPPLELPTTLQRALAALFDDDWATAGPAPFPAPRHQWLPDLQLLSVQGPDGLRLVARGGHNDDPHNHCDVGSYVLARGGTPVVVDAGTGTYTKDSFGPRRYEAWFTRSSFHNVPQIDGVEQGAGPGFRARDVRVTRTADASVLSMELSAAYPGERVRRLERRFTVPADGGPVVVEDAWSCARRPEDVRTHLMLAGPPERREDGSLLLSGPCPVILRVDPRRVETAVEEIRLDDRQLRAVWGERIFRLALVVRAPGAEGTLRACFEAAGPGSA